MSDPTAIKTPGTQQYISFNWIIGDDKFVAQVSAVESRVIIFILFTDTYPDVTLDNPSHRTMLLVVHVLSVGRHCATRSFFPDIRNISKFADIGFKDFHIIKHTLVQVLPFG
jgi:hypothetical protein